MILIRAALAALFLTAISIAHAQQAPQVSKTPQQDELIGLLVQQRDQAMLRASQLAAELAHVRAQNEAAASPPPPTKQDNPPKQDRPSAQ